MPLALVIIAVCAALVASLALGFAISRARRHRDALAALELRASADQVKLSQLEQSMTRERELMEQRVADAAVNKEALLDQFKAVSAEALNANHTHLVQLAKGELAEQRALVKADMEQRTQAIGQLVAPVTEKLTEVDRRITEFDKTRAAGAVQFAGQIDQLMASNAQLRSEATAISRALRQPQSRGAWGEMQLRGVVERAGMAEHCSDFSAQLSTLTDEERRLRPDMVVNLPNGRCIVIDAKTPLAAFLEAAEAEEAGDLEREAHEIRRHAEQVRTHVGQLSSKQYASHIDAAVRDLVILFLPGEHLFSAAVREMPNLIEDAWKKGIVIASPTTLLTLLHAVAQGWKEERIAADAEQIAALGRELHERVAVLAGHFAKVGKNLDGATKAYNQAVGSLEGRVLVTTRKFEALKVATPHANLGVLPGATEQARLLNAPELVAELDVITAQDDVQDIA